MWVIPYQINANFFSKTLFSLKVCTFVVPITDIFHAEFQTSMLIILWDMAILMTNVVDCYITTMDSKIPITWVLNEVQTCNCHHCNAHKVLFQMVS